MKPERSLQNNGLLNTLSQHYFLFFGTLSCHPHGVKMLEKCNVFQWWVFLFCLNCAYGYNSDENCKLCMRTTICKAENFKVLLIYLTSKDPQLWGFLAFFLRRGLLVCHYWTDRVIVSWNSLLFPVHIYLKEINIRKDDTVLKRQEKKKENPKPQQNPNQTKKTTQSTKNWQIPSCLQNVLIHVVPKLQSSVFEWSCEIWTFFRYKLTCIPLRVNWLVANTSLF